MLGIGSTEVLFLLLLSGGTVGLPVGMPPGETDPVLASVAPAECLYYTSWASMGTPDSAGKNEYEQLLGEPEVKRFVNQLDQVLVSLFTQNGADPAQADFARQCALLGKLAVTRPTAIYMSQFKLGPKKQFTGQAAIVVNVGERAEEVSGVLAKITPALPLPAKPVTIAGTTFQQVEAPQDGATLPVTFGVHGKYLIVAAGTKAADDLVARMSAAPPTWLVQAQKDVAVPRPAVIAYVNVAAVIDLILASNDDNAPQIKKYLQAAGWQNVTHYASATGLSETGCTTRTLLGVNGPLEGFLKLAEAKPLAAADLSHVPGNTPIALAVRVDPKTVFEHGLAVAAVNEASDHNPGLSQKLPEFERQLGISLTDLFAALGDTWTFYVEPGGGGLLSGWTSSVTLRDAAKARKIQERLVAMLQAGDEKPAAEAGPEFGAPPAKPQLRRVQLAGHEVFHLRSNDPELPLSVSWCLTDDSLTVAQMPQSIQARLTRPARETALGAQAEVAAMLGSENPPVALGFVDAKPMFRMLYPFLLLGAHSAASESHVSVDLSVIPSGDAIARHMRPLVQGVRRVPAGIEFEQQTSLPGSGISAAMPLLPAALIPAIISARETAQNSVSRNQLKQLAVAAMNYEAVNGAFASAYNASKEGKPLLSWRVHLLPYLDENALYKEFHLDEPWDSEHNKKLIERMPAVYRLPSRPALAGETYYQAVVGKETLMAPPAKEEYGKTTPAGTKASDVADGLSQTLLFVEAAKPVPWTKPEDLEFDPSDPGKGLLDAAAKGFQAALGDGSVRFIHSQIDKDVLKHLLERSDGEAIPNF